MIAIDTNVLMCALINTDDPALSERAQRAIREHAPVFVNDIVLTEFVWGCKTLYKMKRAEIHEILREIVAAAEFHFAHRHVVERAVDGYGSRMSDFADWLIGERNLEHGCTATLTFDKGVAKGVAFSPVPL